MDPRSEQFRRAVEAQDHAAIIAAFAHDAVFHSPVKYHAYEGREAIGRVFTALLESVEDYEVYDELVSDDRVALMFRCTIGGREIEGTHVLRVDASGLIADYTEMARPLSGTVRMFEVLAPRIRELEAAALAPAGG